MTTSQDLEIKRVDLLKEAETLHTRANELNQDEEARLEETLTQIEVLDKDLVHTRRSERIDGYKSKLSEPVRVPPVQSYRSAPRTNSFAEGLQMWMKSHTQLADLSRDAHFRASEFGFNLGQGSCRIPCDYGTLNAHMRAQLSKGGANLGAELMPQTYSQKVTEYLTYFSPLVGLLDSETTSDANTRTYFKLDDTAMESTYTSASAGTEINPTIPDTTLATDSVVINAFDITSGYQKVTYNALRDSAVSLEDKIAKANSNSHARKMEREILNATGDGATGVQGILDIATESDVGGVAAFTVPLIEAMVWQVPEQYRAGCVWVSNSATAGALRQILKDGNERSLFDRSIDKPFEYNMLGGYRYLISSYMPANTLLFFQPKFYMLRLVEGQIFQVLREKFFPNLAFAGIMTFGGAWLGTADTAWTLSIEAS